ncbi:DUF4344 domain-containing metallopeptidase [Streptomyces sp. H27-S2]|uniref:DUF4344 domain-containing metallopeptidase n=1 Tax=Streptomyces antarcticus TaxID=2996458 RepID=UPI002271C181|nr:DUF4344 domain-containing metallopeptidase [Streptomyces sp. H27-S2]MCY0948624.1 DUF4344 domain-containing metallopeptidase [Streptomyces sp. H27-S2]
MSRRWGTLALCAAALLPMAAGAGCAGPEPQPATTGFTLRYEEPAAADRAHHLFLRDRRIVEPVLATLNAHLGLPHEVAVVARSCDGEGSGYDPPTHRIELCYDDLPEERALFAAAAAPPGSPRPDGDPDAELAQVVRETVHHEAGHALLDALHLPAEGDRAEEDAADRFARLMLLRGGRAGAATLLTAARAYDLAAAADPAPDPDDEHAPPAERAESHRCAVYAEAPARHPDLATPARATCPTTWPQARETWTHALTPLLRR